MQATFSHRRAALETFCSILEAFVKTSDHTLRPTHVMYRSNLSRDKTRLFLEELHMRGLVRTVAVTGYRRVAYQLTQEGFSVIQAYRTIKKSLGHEEDIPFET